MQNYTPRLFVIVGSPASGKDELIAAVNIIGALHAEIVPKHTDREWRAGDDDEMICSQIPELNNETLMIQNKDYDLEHCDIIYKNYNNFYGIKTSDIWNKLSNGIFQVIVVSNKEALNKLKLKFGKLAVIIYVYSTITKEEYIENEVQKQEENHTDRKNTNSRNQYLSSREKKFDMAWKLYEDNFLLFDHVLIYTKKQEDLFDQIFRLFKAYEKRLIV
jgi:ribose 1,5-bisphosphokinase PhnN